MVCQLPSTQPLTEQATEASSAELRGVLLICKAILATAPLRDKLLASLSFLCHQVHGTNKHKMISSEPKTQLLWALLLPLRG